MAKLEVPDAGYAWVVAFSACIINMILSGLSRMIGILYVAVIDVYGVSRQEATLPFTVRNSVRCLSGPIVGVFGQRYGIRNVTFWGGVVASLGAALCCIAPNVTWMAVFWGGIHGLGFAFANTLFQVVVNQYFERNRATASGIALSGACLGSLGFPIMIEGILATYGLSGGFLILGGIVMHVLPPSMLLKSPPWVEDPEKYDRQRALLMNGASSTSIRCHIPEDEERQERPKLIRTTSLSNNVVEGVEVSRMQLQKPRMMMHRLEKLVPSKRATSLNVVCLQYNIKESPPTCRRENIQESLTNGDVRENGTCRPENHSSVYTIPVNISSSGDAKVVDADSKKSPKPDVTMLDSIKSIGYLYTNPVYIVISLCMATYVIIFIPILTVIVDYGKDKGMPESYGKYMINAMAIGDLIGRLCFGWVTDKGFMSIPAFMAVVLVLEGVFVALFPFAMSFFTLALLLMLYGVTAGSVLVLFPVLVLQYVGKDVQSVAMGCVGAFSGLVSFGIPFLIGHFRDRVGSYDGMFYLIGIVSVLSGGMWMLEPFMAKRFKNNEKDKELETATYENEAFGNSECADGARTCR